MSLFKLGNFTLHSGSTTRWLVDCNALSDDDLSALAEMVQPLLSPYGDVYGIPRGGLRFAEALRRHDRGGSRPLIVDDVYTTGASMAEMRLQHPLARGVVIFARHPPPDWVTPIWLFGA